MSFNLRVELIHKDVQIMVKNILDSKRPCLIIFYYLSSHHDYSDKGIKIKANLQINRKLVIFYDNWSLFYLYAKILFLMIILKHYIVLKIS